MCVLGSGVFVCFALVFFLNWECFSARVSGVRGLRRHEQPRLKLQLVRTKEMCSFPKGMNLDSCLSGHDLYCVALKVQAVERELSLEGLSYQS